MKKYITIAALLAAGSAFANAEDYSVGSDSAGKNGAMGAIEFDLGDFGITALNPTGFDLDSITLDIYNTWYTNNNMTTGFGIGIYEKTAESNWTLIGKTDWFTHTANAYTGDHEFTVSGDLALTLGKTYTIAFFAGETYFSNLAINSTRDSMSGASEWKNNTHPGADTDNLAAVGILTDSQNGGFTVYQPGDSGSKTDWIPKMTLTGTGAIPEPSAFGLLAGIGALALVASRRRRK